MKTLASPDWLGFPKSEVFPLSLLGKIELAWSDWARGLREWSHVCSWPWFGLAETTAMQGQKGRGTFSSRPPSFDGSGKGDDGSALSGTRDVGFYHEPVMVREVLDALQPSPGKLIFDGTLGAVFYTHLTLPTSDLV